MWTNKLLVFWLCLLIIKVLGKLLAIIEGSYPRKIYMYDMDIDVWQDVLGLAMLLFLIWAICSKGFVL